VNSSNQLVVYWQPEANAWQGPSGIGTQCASGANVTATQQFGVNQTDVFCIDETGALATAWLPSGGNWNSTRLSNENLFTAGAPVAASQHFGAATAQTDVFTETIPGRNGGGSRTARAAGTGRRTCPDGTASNS